MRSSVAVLALHYQNDVWHADGKIHVGVVSDGARHAVTQAARRLLSGARSATLPVIHVRIAFKPDYSDCLSNCELFRKVNSLGALQDGTWGAEFLDELKPLLTETVTKHTRDNPFYLSNLEELLRGLGVSKVIIAGIATNYAVEHATRHASDLGYDVIVAHDACTTAKPHLHAASLETLSLLAGIRSVDEIMHDLQAQ